MKGQWIGDYEATPGGRIVVNMDEREFCFEGTAYVHPGAMDIPKSEIVFRTTDKNTDNFTFTTRNLFPLHPLTHERVRWEDIKPQLATDAVMSNSATVTGKVEGGKLVLSWFTDIGLTGRCSLERSAAEAPSSMKSEKLTWDEFKKRISKLDREQRYIFRGQAKPWPLRTAFHRHGRADVRRFLEWDIPLLHKHLSARTKHLFNLHDRQQNAAFLSLAQHHGYPTNLLDWTYSPYVAAFFAFRGVVAADQSKAGDRVRIIQFDCGQWTSAVQQVLSIAPPMLNVSVVDVLAIENERLIPQQAVAFVSNVDDIEGHIRRYERSAVPLLHALDIPSSERDAVMDELRFMGITAGSLFPGLDGACEELKERNFRC